MRLNQEVRDKRKEVNRLRLSRQQLTTTDGVAALDKRLAVAQKALDEVLAKVS